MRYALNRRWHMLIYGGIGGGGGGDADAAAALLFVYNNIST